MRDRRNDGEYRSWRERVRARGGLESAFCPLPIPAGETCYAFDCEVSIYAPNGPCWPQGGEGVPFFDSEYAISVNRGWSVLDHFGGVDFFGKGRLCVTDRHVYLKGLSVDLQIPLEDVRAVMAACSSIMIGTLSLDRPLLIDSVNGQKMRDVLYRLMDNQGLFDDKMVAEQA